MKKFSLFAFAAAGLLLGACSDKDDVNIAQGPAFTDGAFIGVAIQLPSAQNNTRANEDFDDGETDEFEVKNATLYIFRGDSEDAAEFVGEYVIGTTFDADGGTTKDNVTSTYSEATQISNELAAEMSDETNTDNYYAYVIVNNPGVDAVATGTTFEEFRYREWTKLGTPTAEQEKIGDDGLLMTNAPVCNYAGGSKAPTKGTEEGAEDVAYTTLVKLDRTKIFATADAAKAAPAGCVYVERAAVKITVDATKATTVETTDAPFVSFEGWQIINYPESFYNTRKVDPAWGNLVSYIEALDNDGNSDITQNDFALWNANNQYRFVSGTAFAPYKPTPHVGPFRTYFAEDATYTTDGGLLRPKAVEDATKWIAMDKRGFTTENTFDVAHQKWENTTQVTFKTVIKKGENAADFYTVNGGDDMYTQADALAFVQSGISNVPAVKSALNAIVEALIAKDKEANTDENAQFGYTVALTVAIDGTLTASADKVPLKFDFTVTKTGADSQYGKDDVESDWSGGLMNQVEAAQKHFYISYYKDGVTYYTARIKHFGDYETPWSSTKPFETVAPGETVEQIYGWDDNDAAKQALANNRFLGRYGVVRDNWYKLTVDAVKHIGTAEPVDVSGDGKNTPDDEIENYISIHVHIVPWVLRTQSINF